MSTLSSVVKGTFCQSLRRCCELRSWYVSRPVKQHKAAQNLAPRRSIRGAIAWWYAFATMPAGRAGRTARPRRCDGTQSRAGRSLSGLPVANGPKTTLRRNPINEQGFGRSLVASFWSSKSDFGLDFLDFEMTLRPWRWKMSICYGKADLDNPWNRGRPIDYLDPECVK